MRRGDAPVEDRAEVERAMATDTEPVAIAECQRVLSWVELTEGRLAEAARLAIASGDVYA